jgi:predicted nucleic acid-binding protein
LNVPPGARVYVDANALIYTVEAVTPYAHLLAPLWLRANDGEITLVTSDLTLMEVLVKPLKLGSRHLIDGYEQTFRARQLRVEPVSLKVLREAAALRATAALKTPDAIHAATALTLGCTHLVTNDSMFLRIRQLQVVVLNDLLRAP